jgi:hypothetical protein
MVWTILDALTQSHFSQAPMARQDDILGSSVDGELLSDNRNILVIVGCFMIQVIE